MNKNDARPDDFGVVVLNYNDHTSTIACVKSLIASDPAPRRIIVVDNSSPNDSLTVLQSTLANLPTVDVIDSGHNGGYSYGNNVGIRILREAGFKHVVIATSDTSIETPDFLVHLARETTATTGVIAPQIVSAGAFDNPSVERLKPRYLIDLLWVRWGMPLDSWRKRLAFLVRKVLPRKKVLAQDTTGRIVSSGPARNVYMLHGAFLCLTDAYLTQIGLMDEDIFLFGEEDLMAFLCLQHGLDQVIVPSAVVHHARDSSVSLSWGEKAAEFVVRAQRNSCKVLRRKVSMWPLVRAWLKGHPEHSRASAR